ncbi:MAG: Asp-tRNA(Asn)/Glu-tRNA(Gln) amidotransferase subunit GatB, partial [Dehalococcoidia bacterium]|nr:Asp-tRNA(Asn)/Glu-tRNA(Gln) amidotransferase subunit GatB [Dehalococcoidia bacterium]
FRCDANISIRPACTTKFLTKVEVKNMNSFKAVYRALEYEEQRQRKGVDAGERLEQETRGWVDDKGITVSQRSKEHAHDYRYFPEPDLPPLAISRERVEQIRSRLPELPEAKRQRLVEQYGLPAYDADLITTSRAMADYFEAAVSAGKGAAPEGSRAKAVSNWLLGEFSRLLNAEDIEVQQAKVSPAQLAEMLDVVDRGTLSITMAKKVFEEMFRSGKPASQVIGEQGLTQISESGELEGKIAEVLAGNPRAVADFKAGKETAIGFLMGQVMKATKGRANPAVVRELLKKKLEQ